MQSPHRAPLKILGIETSADDTGIALIDAKGDFGVDFEFAILANAVSPQTIHAGYGGIFPALAKREHAKNLPVVLEQVRQKSAEKPGAIAVTVGPGLEPCLWQGITCAQKLAEEWSVPIVPVNHMEGHIVMSLVHHEGVRGKVLGVSPRTYSLEPITFPAIALLISGGHTELILIKEFGVYEYLGRTRDDAVGEAFDKVARALGLPYPGGPEISRLAEYARRENLKANFVLPRPMMREDNYDFSFSGLKTAVERHIAEHSLQSFDREKLAREFEDSVTEVLIYKALRAVEEYGATTVVMGGGVSANKHIRQVLGERLKGQRTNLLVCPPEYSTDNGLMIALAGYFHALKKEFAEAEKLTANGNLKLC